MSYRVEMKGAREKGTKMKIGCMVVGALLGGLGGPVGILVGATVGYWFGECCKEGMIREINDLFSFHPHDKE